MVPALSEEPLEAVADELDSRHLRRRVLQLVLVAVVVAAAVAALPGLGGVRRHFEHAQPTWLSLAAAAELASAVSYVVLLRAVFCPRMRWRPAYHLGMSELAADSVLPAGGAGGLALGAWALRRGGVSTEHIAHRTVVFFLVTSAANFAAVIVAGLGLALGLLPGRASLALTVGPALVAVASIILVVLVLPRVLDGVAPRRAPASAAEGKRARFGRFLIRTSGTVADGVRGTVFLLASGRPLVIVGSLGYMAFDIAALAACFRATGSALPPLAILVLAYAIGHLGALVPIPGGVGATGGGLIGAFVLYGLALGPVTAAVLLYRLVQVGLPALLGLPAFVLLQRGLRHAEGAMAICEPLAEQQVTAPRT